MISTDLDIPLLGQVDPLRLPLHRFTDGVESAVDPRHLVLYVCRPLTRGHLAQLGTQVVQGVHQRTVLLDLAFQSLQRNQNRNINHCFNINNSILVLLYYNVNSNIYIDMNKLIQ